MISKDRLLGKVQAGYQRLVPSARPWQKIGDFVTFSSSGFVAARSPAELIARHNYEIAEIACLLVGRTFDHSLEIGCGFGRLSQHLGARSVRHLGIDINLSAAQVAARLYPHGDYWAASATALPFADDSFDLVTTWTVIQHVPPNHVITALREIVRVATPEALLLLCEESSSADHHAEKWHTHTWHRHPEFYEEHLHPYQLQYHRPISGLTAAGLTVPGEVMVFSAGGVRRPLANTE